MSVFSAWRSQSLIAYIHLWEKGFIIRFIDLPRCSSQNHNHWNCLTIMRLSWDQCISGLTAAILDFTISYRSYRILITPTSLLEPENIAVADGICFDSLCWSWDIYAFQVHRLPVHLFQLFSTWNISCSCTRPPTWNERWQNPRWCHTTNVFIIGPYWRSPSWISHIQFVRTSLPLYSMAYY